jgi:hypothetical protein
MMSKPREQLPPYAAELAASQQEEARHRADRQAREAQLRAMQAATRPRRAAVVEPDEPP